MGEEVYAFENFFYGLENGTFLDIGALDGVRDSNTLALERVLGWKGVLIEASPTSFSELQKNRPGQLHVNAAVCAREQTVHFLEHPNSCCRGIAGIPFSIPLSTYTYTRTSFIHIESTVNAGLGTSYVVVYTSQS
jgi:hypothetical protein